MRRFRPQNTQQNMTSVEGRELDRILQLTFKPVVTKTKLLQPCQVANTLRQGACYSGDGIEAKCDVFDHKMHNRIWRQLKDAAWIASFNLPSNWFLLSESFWSPVKLPILSGNGPVIVGTGLRRNATFSTTKYTTEYGVI